MFAVGKKNSLCPPTEEAKCSIMKECIRLGAIKFIGHVKCGHLRLKRLYRFPSVQTAKQGGIVSIIRRKSEYFFVEQLLFSAVNNGYNYNNANTPSKNTI